MSFTILSKVLKSPTNFFDFGRVYLLIFVGDLLIVRIVGIKRYVNGDIFVLSYGGFKVLFLWKDSRIDNLQNSF